jgi:adenine deaminase
MKTSHAGSSNSSRPDRDKHSVLPVSAQNGFVFSDTERDILKLMVIERHKASGNIGLGLVKGFGLRSGAIAEPLRTTHNIIAAGVSDDDILVAVSEIRKLQGGLSSCTTRKY